MSIVEEVSSRRTPRTALVRMTVVSVAALLSIGPGCSDSRAPSRAVGSSPSTKDQGSSAALDEPSSPPCLHQQSASTGIASQRKLDHHVDADPQSYDPPGEATPSIDASTALRLSEHTGAPIGNPVDAVLATMTEADRSTSVVWIFTVTNVEVFLSRGAPICTDVAKVVDATTGRALYGLEGTTPTAMRSSTTPTSVSS